MKCLTVRQPWAWCIVHGPKRYENRSWACHHRGPLLIHAGRSRRLITPEVLRKVARLVPHPPDSRRLVFAAIIGVCRLVDCVRVEQTEGDAWAEGPWCFKLADVSPLPEPILCRGQRKIFEVKLTRSQRRLVDAALDG
jgi:hypothetical protein